MIGRSMTMTCLPESTPMAMAMAQKKLLVDAVVHYIAGVVGSE